jgi:hypothetical protein
MARSRKRRNGAQLALNLAPQSMALVRASPSYPVRGYSAATLMRMGAQLAQSLKRTQQKRKRGSQMARVGQFKKGGGRVTNGRRSRSTAIARRSPAKVVTRYRTRTVKVARRRRTAHGTAHGGGRIVPGPFRLKSAAIASIAGYSEAKKGLPMLSDTLAKLPTVGKLPREAVAALILNYFANKSPWIDAAAQAYFDIAGYKLGMSGYEISGDDADF